MIDEHVQQLIINLPLLLTVTAYYLLTYHWLGLVWSSVTVTVYWHCCCRSRTCKGGADWWRGGSLSLGRCHEGVSEGSAHSAAVSPCNEKCWVWFAKKKNKYFQWYIFKIILTKFIDCFKSWCHFKTFNKCITIIYVILKNKNERIPIYLILYSPCIFSDFQIFKS